jgi:bisphosphoglycerate-dependent phosphoglycerate mutase
MIKYQPKLKMNLTKAEVLSLEIPTGIPLFYEYGNNKLSKT